MPLPTSRDVHVDQLQTNVSLKYSNQTYIADEAFPLLPVQKQSNIIPAYDQSYWFRDEAKMGIPGADVPLADYAVDTSSNTYFCPRYRLGRLIFDEIRDNADAPFDLDREATEFLTDKMLLRREVQFVNQHFTTGQWTTDKTGDVDFTKWSNYAGSSPVVDCTTYKDTVEALMGREPNKLIVGKQVYIQLKNHPDVIDLIKYTQRGQITPDLLASLLEFEKFLIGRAIYTTDKEGTAEGSVSYSRVWGKNALMVFTPQSPSLMTPSAGYTIVWNRVAGAAQYMQRFRRDEAEADLMVINSYFSQKRLSARAGLFLSNAVA
jgi:hypothetical protein